MKNLKKNKKKLKGLTADYFPSSNFAKKNRFYAMFFHHVPLDCLRAVWFKAVKDDKTPLFPLPLHNPTPSPPPAPCLRSLYSGEGQFVSGSERGQQSASDGLLRHVENHDRTCICVD